MDKLRQLFPDRMAELEQLAQQQPLVFLEEACAACAAYTRPMRRQTRRLASAGMSGLEVYRVWLEQYMPHIEKVTANVRAGKLHRSFKSALILSDDITVAWMDQEIIKLCAQQGRHGLRQAVKLRRKRARRALEALLGRDDAAIARQATAALTYEQYIAVAKAHKVKVYDRYGAWPQWTTGYQGIIRRHEHKIKRLVQRQLQRIQAQTRRIEQFHGGLVARLFGLDLDLIEVLAARQEYEKALSRMTPSPTKKLDLYEEKTAKIRSPYLDARTDLTAIKDVQDVARQLDEVILEVFDLDTTEKNCLVASMKEYRRLAAEKQALDLKLSRTR